MNNKNIAIIIGAVVLVAASFYAGMSYASSQKPTRGGNGQFSQQGGANGQRGMRGNGGGFISGEILSKDATGITVKMKDGGSKIVFVATSSEILKSVTGTLDDLSVGGQITVMGTQNQDGSVSAQTVQLRPQLPPSTPKQ